MDDDLGCEDDALPPTSLNLDVVDDDLGCVEAPPPASLDLDTALGLLLGQEPQSGIIPTSGYNQVGSTCRTV